MQFHRRTVSWLWAVAMLLALVVGPTTAAEAADARDVPGTLVVHTVPPTEGVVVTADGNRAVTDSQGIARLPVDKFRGLSDRLEVPDAQVSGDTRVQLDRILGSPDSAVRGKPLVVGLRIFRKVTWSFSDRQRTPVPLGRITSMRLRSSTGQRFELKGSGLGKPLWVLSVRTVQTSSGLVPKDLYYVVDHVIVEGGEVVNSAQQRFVPNVATRWPIELLFYALRVTASDVLFGGPAGAGITLTRPDGKASQHQLPEKGPLLLSSLPRGSYTLEVSGTPVALTRPLTVSRDQDVELKVITTTDVVVVISLILFVALMLLVSGRPGVRALPVVIYRRSIAAARHRSAARAAAPKHAASRRTAGGRTHRRRGTATTLVLLLTVTGALATGTSNKAFAQGPSRETSSAGQRPTPVLAYYYLWYNPTSWNRAKTDYPLLGRYSSDEVEVMRQHIVSAKSAGITGFLVSWKATPVLIRRLETLAKIARAEHFTLGIVYQGLDFRREPLPIPTVEKDLAYFDEHMADDPVYRIFDRPLVVWTGTERVSASDVATVTGPHRADLLILASAKTVEDYQRIATAVDGNAYYWSAANISGPSQVKRLEAMSEATHAHGGLWIAPAAPGFDARLVGGKTVVERRNGATLRENLAAARASSPDALGIISWNEFSENTHIEPSQRYGDEALQTVADVLGAGVAVIGNPDSSSTDEAPSSGLTGIGALLAIVLAVGLLNAASLLLRRRSDRPDSGADNPPNDGVPNSSTRTSS
jgi:hypothetical protein